MQGWVIQRKLHWTSEEAEVIVPPRYIRTSTVHRDSFHPWSIPPRYYLPFFYQFSFFMATSSNPYCAQDYDESTATFILNVGTLTKPHQRWRLAFIVIYSSWVLFSLVKDVLVHKKQQLLTQMPPSPSYTALDIIHHKDDDRGDCIPLSNIDQKSLMHVVKEKNLEYVGLFGGVEGVASVIGVDVENGIRGDAHDLNHRRNAFGSNTYQKPAAKGFFHYVLNGLKDTTIFIFLGLCHPLSGFWHQRRRP